MVRLTILILATLSGQYAEAFVPASFHRGVVRQQTFSLMSVVDENDVMAPSENSIRKAYDDWRAKYNKGGFDSARFETFKSNYQAIADANMKAKAIAGDGSTPMLSLNEFGDFTAEEYEAMKANPLSSSSSTQSASVAETSPEDSRLRAAYLKWCEDIGKKPDESRFQTFSSNYRTMESFAASSGKAMVLNKYADCTKEEYEELMNGTKVLNTAKKDLTDDSSTPDKAKDNVTGAVQVEAEKVTVEPKEIKKVTEDVKSVKSQLAEKKKEKAAERELLLSLSEAELKERAEKERKQRQANQEKVAEELRKASEAAAIAAVKEQEAREAAQIAKRKQFDIEAAELVRKQAREWEEKQKVLSARYAPAPSPKFIPKPKVKRTTNALKSPVTPKEPEKPPPFFSLFTQAKEISPAEKIVPKQSSSPVPMPVREEFTFSFFGNPSPKTNPVPKKVSKPAAKVAPIPTIKEIPKPAAKIVPKPSLPIVSKSSPSPKTVSVASKPKVETSNKEKTPLGLSFSFFGSPTPEPKSPPPAPAAAPPAPKATPSFSFFGSPAPAPKVVPQPATKAPPSPSFSLFPSKPKPSTSVPKPVASVPKAVIPEKSFSFFGSKKPAPPAPAPVPAPVPKPAFSFFGGSPATQPKPKIAVDSSVKKSAPKKTPLPPVRRSGTIALQKVDPKKGKDKPPLFGTRAVNDNIPVLSKFKQNKDGSLTGIVSNASGYRTGTKITTSPVRMGAKAGQIVTTESGSKYRLE